MLLEKLNPAIDRRYLILLAGIIWCGAGMALISFAVSWLNLCEYNTQMIFYLVGFMAAMLIHYFWFSRLAKKNIDRLMMDDKKKKLFSFITWESYLIIIVMIVLGVILKHTTFPKQYISILYNGIGLGLLFTGVRYVRTSLVMLYPGAPPEQ